MPALPFCARVVKVPIVPTKSVDTSLNTIPASFRIDSRDLFKPL